MKHALKCSTDEVSDQTVQYKFRCDVIYSMTSKTECCLKLFELYKK